MESKNSPKRKKGANVSPPKNRPSPQKNRHLKPPPKDKKSAKGNFSTHKKTNKEKEKRRMTKNHVGENATMEKMERSKGENNIDRTTHQATTTHNTTNATNQPPKTPHAKKGKKGKNEYIKTALYAYPALKAVAKEMSEHIETKAIRSHASYKTGEDIMVYLIEKIWLKDRVDHLRATLNEVFDDLTKREKFLLYVRYFGRRKNIISALPDEKIKAFCGSRRTYYRRQEELLQKIGARLRAQGMTSDVFYRDFGEIDLIKKLDKSLANGRRMARLVREREVVEKLERE